MLLTCRDDVGRMLIGFDFFQASQVVSWQNVGRMLRGQYVERMLIQLEKALFGGHLSHWRLYTCRYQFSDTMLK